MAERRAALLLASALLAGTANADGFDDAAREEAPQLATWAAAVSREDLSLRIRVANGQVVRFDSVHPPHEADTIDFRLAGATRDGKFFVVLQRTYEAESLYWVSRADGRKFEVYGPPAVSPDGRYAVTALAWESFGPSGVFIWEIVGDQLVQRGRIEPAGGYGLFTFQRWTGKDRAELQRYSHADPKFCPKSQGMTATVHLARSHDGWTLAGPANAREVRCE